MTTEKKTRARWPLSLPKTRERLYARICQMWKHHRRIGEAGNGHRMPDEMRLLASELYGMRTFCDAAELWDVSEDLLLLSDVVEELAWMGGEKRPWENAVTEGGLSRV